MPQLTNNISITNGMLPDSVVPCIDHDGDQVCSTTNTHDDIILDTYANKATQLIAIHILFS